MTQRLFKPSLAGGELSPSLYGRVDLGKYAVGLRRCRNFLVHRTGGVSNRPGFAYLGDVANAAVCPALVPFRFNASADQVCLLEFGDYSMRIWYQGGLILNGSGNPVVVTTPYSAAQAAEMDHAQSGDILYLAHPSFPPKKLARTSWTSWTLSTLNFAPTLAAPSAIAASGNSNWPEDLAYKVTAISAITGEESLPSPIGNAKGPSAYNWPVGAEVFISWTDQPNIAYHRVYKEKNGLYGYIGLSATGKFYDDNITPDISDAPPDAENPFNSAGNYPSKVAFHQQRLCFAATNNAPNGVWMSRTGFYENMSKSTPTKDDDAITFSLGSGEVNAIKGMISVNELIILTGGSENVCNGGSTGAALTPSSITVKPQSYWGAGDLPPLVSGNTVLFLQGLGSAVRDLGYEYSVDGFTGNDQSIMARHLMEASPVVDWAYAQVPDSVFWMVRADGALVSLTYFKEQDVGAWALHSTNGRFERVAVIEGDERHDVYVVVAREINGQTRRSIERLSNRLISSNDDAAFLDAHVIFDGRASGSTTNSLTGLDHLEGATIGLYADGNVLDDAVVVGGAVALPAAYGRVVAGLRYDADSIIETLDVDLGMVQGLGTVQARKMVVSSVTLRLQKSREFWAGPDENTLTLTKAVPDVFGQAPALYSGDVKISIASAWDSNGRVVIRPAGPVPLTVLSIGPDITIGG
jgi:hypothetical protein